MSSRGFLLSCFRSDGGASTSRALSPRPRYPSMPKYPKGGMPAGADLEALLEEEPNRKVAVFSVVGMTCSACAGSVEKAIKRLPGIHDAAVDVLNNRAQVIFYPAFVSNDDKYRCSETGYHLPLKCVEEEEEVQENKEKNKNRRRLVSLEKIISNFKWRKLLDDSSSAQSSDVAGMKQYITYRSCVPVDSEEKLSVIGFEGLSETTRLIFFSCPPANG